MAETLETIEQLAELPHIYDKYFVSLAQGNPEAPKLPSFSAKDLSKLLMEELADKNKLSAGEINDVLDAAKIGFTSIKFARTGRPAWMIGYKLTGTLYYPEVENPEEGGKEYDGNEA